MSGNSSGCARPTAACPDGPDVSARLEFRPVDLGWVVTQINAVAPELALTTFTFMEAVGRAESGQATPADARVWAAFDHVRRAERLVVCSPDGQPYAPADGRAPTWFLSLRTAVIAD